MLLSRGGGGGGNGRDAKGMTRGGAHDGMEGWGDDHCAIGVVDALDSGEGRRIASAMTTMPMRGPGSDDVEAVGRFRRAGRR